MGSSPAYLVHVVHPPNHGHVIGSLDKGNEPYMCLTCVMVIYSHIMGLLDQMNPVMCSKLSKPKPSPTMVLIM